MTIRAVSIQGDLGTLKKTLRARTAQLDAAAGLLTRATKRRRAAQAALRSTADRQGILRERSASLQHDVRHMAQEMMVRQERQRTRISRTLQDDLAQTLLGINVHLLLLKTRAGLGKRELIGDIVKAQRMVDTTASSVRRAMQRIRRP